MSKVLAALLFLALVPPMRPRAPTLAWSYLYAPTPAVVWSAPLLPTPCGPACVYSARAWLMESTTGRAFRVCGTWQGHGFSTLTVADLGDPVRVDADGAVDRCYQVDVPWGAAAGLNVTMNLQADKGLTLTLTAPNIVVGQTP